MWFVIMCVYEIKRVYSYIRIIKTVCSGHFLYGYQLWPQEDIRRKSGIFFLYVTFWVNVRKVNSDTDMLVSEEAPFGLPSSFKNDTFAWITWIIVKTFVFVCKKANRSEVFSYILDFFFSPVDPKHHLVAVQLQWILPPQPSPWPPCKRQK